MSVSGDTTVVLLQYYCNNTIVNVFGSLGSNDLENYNDEESVSSPPVEDQRSSFSQA